MWECKHHACAPPACLFRFWSFKNMGNQLAHLRDPTRDVNDLLLRGFRTERPGNFNPILWISRKDLSVTVSPFSFVPASLDRVFHSSLSSESSHMIGFIIPLTLPDSGNVSRFAPRRLSFHSVVRELVDLTLTFLSFAFNVSYLTGEKWSSFTVFQSKSNR